MAFYDRPDCLNVSPYVDKYGTKSGIFIFKNVVPKEMVERIEANLKALPEQNPTYDETLISWYSEKMTAPIEGTIELWEFISELIGPEWVIHPSNNFIKVIPGNNGMFIHSDSPGKGACNLLSQVDVWSTCCELDYGVCTYFGDYEGGAIFYPNINPDGTLKTTAEQFDGPCFEYTPQKGDIVIHSAFDPYAHGVREVTSGVRYVFSNFSLKAVDNPGTFHNYGTPEYIKQIGNKTMHEVVLWMDPLKQNPQFTKDLIKVYQDSGLTGEALAEAFFSDMQPE